MKKIYEFGLKTHLLDCQFFIEDIVTLQWCDNVPLFAVLHIEDGLGEMWLLSMEEYEVFPSSIKHSENTEVWGIGWVLGEDSFTRVKDRKGHSSDQKVLINTKNTWCYEDTRFYEELCHKFRKIQLKLHYEDEP